jgi:hypothetical protein
MLIGLLALSVSKPVRLTGAQKDPIQGLGINPRRSSDPEKNQRPK